MKILTISTYGGCDWHDSGTEVSQVVLPEGNTDEALKGEIVREIVAHSPFSVRQVLDALESKSEIKTVGGDIFRDKENGKEFYENEHEILFQDDEIILRSEYYFGQNTYSTRLYVEEIAEENLRWVAEEQFYSPNKYTDMVERIYEMPFETRKEAEKALERLNVHSKFGAMAQCNCKKVLAIDVSNETVQRWLELQKIAIDLMKEKGVTPNDENTFSAWVEEHIRKLKEKEVAA